MARERVVIQRGEIRVRSDGSGVSVHDGHEGVFLTHDEWRWLVTMVGPALIPREPTVAEKLRGRQSQPESSAANEDGQLALG